MQDSRKQHAARLEQLLDTLNEVVNELRREVLR
jgi:hypothetical protein